MEQWVLDGRKFLTGAEIGLLKKVCRTEKEKLIINLGLLAGLRVKEIADLKWSDISLKTQSATLIVRHGKGGKMRLVRFNGELKESFIRYLTTTKTAGIRPSNIPPSLNSAELTGSNRKETLNEGIGADDFLFKSEVNNGPVCVRTRTGRPVSRRTVQRVFERAARRAGISGHSFHHLRHTYASYLYRAGNYNLRLVQKQLGHASIKTTQVYADVFDEDLTRAVERLYKPR